ncbi:MAG: ArsR family transcriptional regulator [Candidatus Thorarchaeota archaeon]|nr:ArsR family transcriptional regulator [Candidatus Thorarchaeota archaeon]
MIKPKIHIAFYGTSKTTEYLAVKRCIDEIIIVHSSDQEDVVNQLIEKYSEFGIMTTPLKIVPDDFTNILATVLDSIDSRKLDHYDIEVSVSTNNCIVILAACMFAAIAKASMVCVQNDTAFNISEIWPSELVNLSSQKREILSYLDHCERPVHQKEVAEETEIRQSGLSRHLRSLELAGYVTRWRMSRCKHVSITNLGRAILHYKRLRKRRVWNSYTQPLTGKIQVVG